MSNSLYNVQHPSCSFMLTKTKITNHYQKFLPDKIKQVTSLTIKYVKQTVTDFRYKCQSRKNNFSGVRHNKWKDWRWTEDRWQWQARKQSVAFTGFEIKYIRHQPISMYKQGVQMTWANVGMLVNPPFPHPHAFQNISWSSWKRK